MKQYLSKLLPRIKQYSQTLDKKELFVDAPWVIIDEQQNQQKYIFKRDGELVMSLNGHVTIGKWEYLSAARSLLIDRNVDKILLNQSFIDPAVMVLRKDGSKEENLVLANEVLLPDLDVVKYLKDLFYQKNNIKTSLLRNGERLEFHNCSGVINENIVTIEGEPVPNGTVVLAKSGRKLLIKDSKIIKVIVRQSYDTNFGTIIIERGEDSYPSKGDFVYMEGETPAYDGRYKLGFMKYITVENGRITK